jgi:hypothetical protein
VRELLRGFQRTANEQRTKRGRRAESRIWRLQTRNTAADTNHSNYELYDCGAAARNETGGDSAAAAIAALPYTCIALSHETSEWLEWRQPGYRRIGCAYHHGRKALQIE